MRWSGSTMVLVSADIFLTRDTVREKTAEMREETAGRSRSLRTTQCCLGK